jgi:hypothetical protein
MNRLRSLVLLVAGWAVAGSALADTLLAAVDEALKEPIRLVAEWESDRTIAFSMVAIVFVLGAVIAIIHTLPTNAAKFCAVILGSTVTLLTALSNAYFDFDHRQYKAMASLGRQLLTGINIRKIQLQEFPGNADGRDYSAVLQVSRQNAYDEARAYLARRLQAPGTNSGVDSASAAKYLLDSARVASTYSYYDRNRNTIRAYTLVSLSKKVAESDLRLFGAKNSQAVSPVQQQLLRSAVRTQESYISKRKEVMRSQ